MKKILKAIWHFFVLIWNFLFGNEKEEVTPVEAQPSHHMEEKPVYDKILRHNNRKNTRGRHTQFVLLGNGIYRPIYHNR